MDWKTLFFSFNGRINRAKYWLAVLIFAIAFLVVGIVGGILYFILGETVGLLIAGLLGLAILIFSVWTGLAVGLKRLHDREKSGWWLLVFWLLPLILNGIGTVMGDVVGGALSLVSFGISVWAIIEFGCLKGTTGPNMYGPDPLPPEG